MNIKVSFIPQNEITHKDPSKSKNNATLSSDAITLQRKLQQHFFNKFTDHLNVEIVLLIDNCNRKKYIINGIVPIEIKEVIDQEIKFLGRS
jgi:hypothetical protein